MNFDNYLRKTGQNFSETHDIKIGEFDGFRLYDELFKSEWLATKLKIFSYIAYFEKLDEETMKLYTDECINKTLQDYKSMPRSAQNGVVSFCVAASENVVAEAAEFAEAKPKKHPVIMNMPVIYDLWNRKSFYYDKAPKQGILYYEFFRKYIQKNFIPE